MEGKGDEVPQSNRSLNQTATKRYARTGKVSKVTVCYNLSVLWVKVHVTVVFTLNARKLYVTIKEVRSF